MIFSAAATGPGSSTQHAALDWIAPAWQAGVFAGRVRWETDALYRQPTANFFRHDVSVLGGVRGALRVARLDASAELRPVGEGPARIVLFDEAVRCGDPDGVLVPPIRRNPPNGDGVRRH